MGVRTLVGELDGTTPAAVMIDSASGWTIGPVFEGDEAPEQIEAFLEWLRREPYIALAGEMGLSSAFIPDPRRDQTDPRVWPESGLEKLVAYWRREYLDEDGYLKPAAGRRRS